jgi:DNA invertase Pin-like site-specific DNA recombinase
MRGVPTSAELRYIQRRLSPAIGARPRPTARLSPAEVEALTADYEGGGRVEELARIDGVHRTTVSRAGRVRPAVG